MRHGASGITWAALALAPLIATVALFVAVLRSGVPVPLARRELPHEARRPDRCTWSCHDRGCSHAPVLPRLLTGDDGLFGVAMRALHGTGAALAPASPGAGYRLANLLVFCALWPGGMYALWLIALRQRRRLRALAREGG